MLTASLNEQQQIEKLRMENISLQKEIQALRFHLTQKLLHNHNRRPHVPCKYQICHPQNHYHNADQEERDSNFTDNWCDLTSCIHLFNLKKIMTSYNFQSTNLEDIDIAAVINDALHLQQHHGSNDHDFAFISNAFGLCNIHQCNIFRRNYRDRSQFINNNKRNEYYKNANITYCQILDKIHCYYQHCYDIGNKLSIKEKQSILDVERNDSDNFQRIFYDKGISKISGILSEKRENNKSISQLRNHRNNKYNQINEIQSNVNNIHKYSFGSPFSYVDEEEQHYDKDIDAARKWDRYIIFPKYSSLKEELVANIIESITIEQFNNEYKKGQLYVSSLYNKKKRYLHQNNLYNHFGAPEMCIENILAILLYCNYDDLQRKFSQTYRQDNMQNHNNYFHFGWWLKETVKEFGNGLHITGVKSFYHGVSETLVFPSYLIDVYVHCPLSTSSSFEVAVNFTNHNNGLVVEFAGAETVCGGYHKTPCDWKVPGRSISAKYFSCAWLSDYGNEFECLFVQNRRELQFVNIVDVKFNIQYKTILQALKNMDKITHIDKVWNLKNNDMNSQCLDIVTCKLIENQLAAKFKQFEDFPSLTSYAKEVINVYCKNNTNISMDYSNLTRNESLRNIFFHCEYQWIKLKVICSLYPNLENIIVKNINLDADSLKLIFEDILFHLSSNRHTMLASIEIHVNEEINDLYLSPVMLRYTEKFLDYHFCIEWKTHQLPQ
eukprot:348898_1